MLDSPAIESRLDTARDLAIWARDTLTRAETAFDGETLIARALGAQVDGDVARFGFWTPELLELRVPEGDVFLEVLRPTEPLDLTVAAQNVRFTRAYLPVARYEAHTFAAATGLRAGGRDLVGDFYALVWRDADGAWHRILDPMAASLPFGAFAPAELYDTGAMQAARGDLGYWRG